MKEKRKLEDARIMAAMHGIKLGEGDGNQMPNTEEEKNAGNKRAAMMLFGDSMSGIKKGQK